MTNLMSKAHEVYTVAPGNDGNLLYAAGSDSVVQMWDIRTPRKVAI